MNQSLSEKLRAAGLLSEASYQNIQAYHKNKLFSLYWELRLLLYLGVLLLAGGLGILVYKNIDAIGHTAIVIFIALLFTGSFAYCIKKSSGFNWNRIDAPNPFYDYILLLGCLSFVTFIAYIQYQYHFFGDRLGLASGIPMLVLFMAAYYFDNLGILSLAITSLCAWAGITVTPTRILQDNDFESSTILFTGMVTGAGLLGMAAITRLRNLKSHFGFTYFNFGAHVLCICLLAAMFHFNEWYFPWFLPLAALCYYFFRTAMQQKSFYTLLIATLYGFIGLSAVVVMLLLQTMQIDLGGIVLCFLYFIGAGIGLILFLISMNKKIKNE